MLGFKVRASAHALCFRRARGDGRSAQRTRGAAERRILTVEKPTGGAFMQTQLMQSGKTDAPWFERTASESQEVERTPIQSVPFSIGRIETADLQIDSGRVSREHAVVVKEGKSYRLRDLGSTNGTLVNGEPIDDVELCGGDIVVIADHEFIFVDAEAGSARRMATQVMTGAGAAAVPLDRIVAVRRLQESLLHRGFRPRLKTIVDLQDGRPWGYVSDALEADQPRGTLSWLASPFACSTWRACQMHRTLAAEAFQQIRQQESLFVGVSAEEAEGNGALPAQLEQLRNLVGQDALVVSLPAELYEVARSPLLETLKQRGCLTALSGFMGSSSQVDRLAAAAPDFLLLSPTMSRDLHGARQRRQLASIPEACERIGCRPIVCDLTSPADEDVGRELGFQLALSPGGGGSGAKSSAKRLALAGV